MKLKYWVGGFVMAVILLLSSLGLTQQTEDSSNHKGVNESQNKYVIGLQINSEPISYKSNDDDKDNKFEGYCHAFIETLKNNFHLNIETKAVLRDRRFIEQHLDATCGPDTITNGRIKVELKKLKGDFSKPFARTRIAVLLEKKNEDTLLSPVTKQDLKIGVISGTTTEIVVKALYPILDKNIVEVDNFDKAIDSLSRQETIAYFDDEVLLRGKFKKIQSNHPGKEFVIRSIPSMMEYGLMVFHINEKKNNELLRKVNELLGNENFQDWYGAKIHSLNNRQSIEEISNLPKEDNQNESTPTRISNDIPTKNYWWLLVFPGIGIFLLCLQSIRPKKNTLDLYHNSSVDPSALAISFKRLAENHPEAELRIVGMEVPGEGEFLLHAKTAPKADKSKLSLQYFKTYNRMKGLSEEIKILLLEKDNHIRFLETTVSTTLQRPNFYSSTQIEKINTMTHNPGGFSVGGSVGRDINNLQGDNNRAIQGDDNQGVLGDNNQVTQQNQSDVNTEEPLTKDDIVKLLVELETLIKGADLPEKPKEEAIDEISAVKKAADKEEPNKKTALAHLESVAETLEKTSKTVDAGQKLWDKAKPIIVKVAKWLGVAAGSYLLGLN